MAESATNRVILYSTGSCPACDHSKRLLNQWAIPFTELRVDQDRTALRQMMRRCSRARTVPQITVDDRWIGGLPELIELDREGRLADLMNVSK